MNVEASMLSIFIEITFEEIDRYVECERAHLLHYGDLHHQNKHKKEKKSQTKNTVNSLAGSTLGGNFPLLISP